MLKGFEDAFVDVQASVISLCLELLSNSGRTAEKIYVYLYQNNDIDYIDAFFEQEGKLYTTNDWFPAEKISDFFDCGVEDIEKLIDICNAYDSKCPHELKLTYNVISKSFDSNYNYDNVTEVLDKDVLELVEDWFKSVTKTLLNDRRFLVCN